MTFNQGKPLGAFDHYVRCLAYHSGVGEDDTLPFITKVFLRNGKKKISDIK